MCCNGYVNNYQTAGGNCESEYTTLPFGYGRCHGCQQKDEYEIKGYFEGKIFVEKECRKPMPSYVVTPIYIDNGNIGGGCNNFDNGFNYNPSPKCPCQRGCQKQNNWLDTFCFCKMFR